MSSHKTFSIEKPNTNHNESKDYVTITFDNTGTCKIECSPALIPEEESPRARFLTTVMNSLSNWICFLQLSPDKSDELFFWCNAFSRTENNTVKAACPFMGEKLETCCSNCSAFKEFLEENGVDDEITK